MAQPLTITVYGLPAPQGSKRHVGNGVMIESSKNVKPWRLAVKHAALDQTDHLAGAFFTGAVAVEMIFTMPKPKSTPKGRFWPDRKPDLSKLVRSTEDALTDAGVWEDDARVINCVASKTFPNAGVGALHIPGARIRIWSA